MLEAKGVVVVGGGGGLGLGLGDTGGAEARRFPRAAHGVLFWEALERSGTLWNALEYPVRGLRSVEKTPCFSTPASFRLLTFFFRNLRSSRRVSARVTPEGRDPPGAGAEGMDTRSINGNPPPTPPLPPSLPT